jgi:hypothetical protein
MIFDYVIVSKLSKKAEVAGELEDLIAGPETIPAHDKKSAELKAVKNYAAFDPDTMEVIVRPFVD